MSNTAHDLIDGIWVKAMRMVGIVEEAFETKEASLVEVVGEMRRDDAGGA
jgi:hypothetical protein